MLNFALTEEQEAVRTMVRQFVDKEINPYFQEWDAKGHFEQIAVANCGFAPPPLASTIKNPTA